MSNSNLATAEQLRLPIFSTYDHHELLLTQQQNDVASWSKPENKWQMLDKFRSADVLSKFFDAPDFFVSPNEFHGWRRLVLLAGLNALYLDFDSHTVEMSQKEIHAWAEKTLKKIVKLGWPLPNALIFSGRGFHLYWRHHREHKNALPRWQSLVRHMRKTLDSDIMSADSCRVLRLVGSQNSKVDNFRVHGEKIEDGIYEFEHLYETILQPQKAEIRDIRAAQVRAEIGKPQRDPAKAYDPKKHTSIFTYWRNVHKDIWLIASSLDTGNGVEEGNRTQILEVLAASLAWFTHAQALDDEVVVAARTLIPTMPEEEVLSSTSTLRRRAQVAARGDLVEYKGKMGDARYKYSREKLWEKVGPLVKPELINQLSAILPRDVADEREEVRQKGRDRVAEGKYSKHHADEQTRATARLLRAQGMILKEVAAAVGHPLATVARWCNQV